MDPQHQDLRAQRPGHALLAHLHELLLSNPAPPPQSNGTPTDLVFWAVGYVGEEIVGTELLRLPPDWHILHGLTRGPNVDIDHLVIGPGGVFTINTKNHTGAKVDVRGDAVFLYGDRQTYIPAARSEATDAQAALSRALPWPVEVHPVVAVIADRVKQKEPTVGATVLEHRQLVPWLMACPPRLQPEHIEFIASTAARPGTWTDLPPTPAAPYWVADYSRKITAAYQVGRTEAVKPRTSPAPRNAGRYPPPTSARRPRARQRSGSLRVGISVLILAFLVLYLTTRSNGLVSLLKNPGSTSNTFGSIGAWCNTVGASGTDMLTGKPDICASNATEAPTWRLAAPYLLLPIQMPNSSCPTPGQHARAGAGYEVLTCIKNPKTAARTWTIDTRWTPWATQTTG